MPNAAPKKTRKAPAVSNDAVEAAQAASLLEEAMASFRPEASPSPPAPTPSKLAVDAQAKAAAAPDALMEDPLAALSSAARAPVPVVAKIIEATVNKYGRGPFVRGGSGNPNVVSPLHEFAQHCQSEASLALLIAANPSALNATDFEGDPPLYYAYDNRAKGIVEMLMSAQAPDGLKRILRLADEVKADLGQAEAAVARYGAELKAAKTAGKSFAKDAVATVKAEIKAAAAGAPVVKLLEGAASVEAVREVGKAVDKAQPKSPVMILGTGETLSAYAIVPNPLTGTIAASKWVFEALAAAAGSLAVEMPDNSRNNAYWAEGVVLDPSNATKAEAKAKAYAAAKLSPSTLRLPV